MIEMSSAWRDDSRGTDCSESIFRHRRVIQTRSQRQIGCRATSSSGSREMSVDRETQMTITRREILHRVPQRLKLTEQQSWQDIAQSKGMTYLQRLPEAIPEGQFLVHNSVRPTHPLGSHGCRPCWWICAGCRGSAISSRMSMHSARGQGALARHRG